MRKTALAMTALLSASTLLAEAPRPAPAPASPRIAVEPASFDFGKAVRNRTLRKEFTLRNFGNADLVIERVTTTCGCTVAEGYSNVLKPGRSTALRVSLETRSYSGRMTRSVLIKSNDPTNALLEVKVEAAVVEGP